MIAATVLWTRPAAADRIILSDGRTVSGHILQDNPDTGRVVIAVVANGERTGIQEIFFRHEIKSMERTGEFADAPLREPGAACYQYGVQWGRCTMAAYFGYRCEDLEKFVVPFQCSDTPDMKKGIRAGVESVYLDFPEIPGRDRRGKDQNEN